MRARKPWFDWPWAKVRLQILERDSHRCQLRISPNCKGRADQVDHIVRPEDGGAWYDERNLQAACKTCNVAKRNKEQRENWRSAPTRIVLVMGPPGAGKLAYIEQRKTAADMVIDYDTIAASIGDGGALDAATRHSIVNDVRGGLLRRMRAGTLGVPRVWLTSTRPDADSFFPHHEVVRVDPGRGPVESRLRSQGRMGSVGDALDGWYAQSHQPSPSRAWWGGPDEP